MMGTVIDAGLTGLGLFWRAFWALAFGYAISAAIQVFVSHKAATKHLGEPTPRKLGLAMLLGFASSSCSFAALSATRSIWTKGAHLVAALAFMFASTNLAVEVAALAFIFLGWQFALALFVGAPLLVVVMAGIVKVWRPKELEERALERASGVGDEMGVGSDAEGNWKQRVKERASWERVGRAYVGEWKMVWKELSVGFAVAGVVATAVPEGFFTAIFPSELASGLLVVVHAAVAPFLAVITVIGSMGNGPLAAILFENGVVFGGIMAFLYSDFVVPPSLKINATYYGWRFAFYLGAVFAIAAIVAGVMVHFVFSLAGLIPESAKSVEELASFGVDYSLFLNIFAIVLSIGMIKLAREAAD